MPVQPERVRKLNDKEEQRGRDYVLYWAQMNRRVDANHGLLRAVEIARELNLPVLFYEGLTFTYGGANDRLHTFALQGVPETAKRLEKAGIGYVFYLRRNRDSPNDVLYQLAKRAACVVTDDYPIFIAAGHNARVPDRVDCAYYIVDSSCVVPMAQIPGRQFAAYTIRPRIHRLLPNFLHAPDSLRVKHRWVGTIPKLHVHVESTIIPKLVASCDIDHGIQPSLSFEGGRLAAERLLKYFLEHNLKRFETDRNEPVEHATSHLSPYLHFGQISSLEVALAVRDYAQKHKISPDAYLEELIVRRELSFNYAAHVKDPKAVSNLPAWVQETMKRHKKDPRKPTYTPRQMESATTYDDLWNATQKEMLLRGKIHGYYRMYWGKKIIEWSRDYQGAVDFMIDQHERYALDGRDPNTYTNILWCLGLHDRAWGERPIFGKIRYMSGDSVRRKTNARAYIDEIAEFEQTGKDPAKTV